MVSISSWVRRASFLNEPNAGSANQGGISRAATFALIERAQGRAS